MKIKIRPIFKDISLTFIAEAFLLVSFFVVYRLIAKNLGPDGVGEFSLIKRVAGLVQSFLFVGLAVGIPRYVAMSRTDEGKSRYTKAAGLIVGVLMLIFFIFINLIPDVFAKFFFGSVLKKNLVIPLFIYVAGISLHLFIYSYLRGKLLVKFFNIVQIINLAIVPVIVFAFFNSIAMDKLVITIGLINLTVAFVFLIFLFKEIFIPISKNELLSSVKELIKYSFPRFLAGFVYALFLSIGAIFAVHTASIEEVGYLSVSQNLLLSLSVVVFPLNLIIFPKISGMISLKQENEIKENLNYLIGAVIQCSFFVFVQLIIFSDTVLVYWLGSNFLPAVTIMRIVFLSTIFYIFSSAVGGVLEASKVKPINFENMSISVAISIVITVILLYLVKIFTPIMSLSIGFSAGLICLGCLSYISVRKIYPEKIKTDLTYFLIAVIINILLGSVAWILKPFIISRFYNVIIFEIGLCLLYVVILWILRMDWIRKIPEKILTR